MRRTLPIEKPRGIITKFISFTKSKSSLSVRYYDAISRDQLENIKVMFKGDKINFRDERNQTPFMYAAHLGRLDIINFMITNNKVNYFDVDDDNKNALHFAIHGNHPDIVRLLVKKFSQLAYKQDSFGCNSLCLAAKLNFQDVALIIIQSEKDTCSYQDNSGHYPLHYAAHHQNFDLVGKLLKLDSSKLRELNNYGKSPLHLAIRKTGEDLSTIKLIVEHMKKIGMSLIQLTSNNMDPIHLALLRNRNAALYLFKEIPGIKWSSLPLVNNKGTILHKAVKLKDLEFILHILENDPQLISKRDSQNITPFELSQKILSMDKMTTSERENLTDISKYLESLQKF